MIRCIAVLTTMLLLTISCSGSSDTDTAQVPASAPTATVAQPTLMRKGAILYLIGEL